MTDKQWNRAFEKLERQMLRLRAIRDGRVTTRRVTVSGHWVKRHWVDEHEMTIAYDAKTGNRAR